MFKQFFEKSETTQLDVVMHVVAAGVAIYKALDEYKSYSHQEKS